MIKLTYLSLILIGFGYLSLSLAEEFKKERIFSLPLFPRLIGAQLIDKNF
jgi:hypothetical protein